MRTITLAVIIGSSALGTGISQAQDSTVAGQGLPLDSVANRTSMARYLQYFTGPARDRTSRWLDRSGRFHDLITSRLAEQGVPSGVAFLPMIESGYSNTAVSRAGAVGMWQFIPETARRYGLTIDRYVDERRDPLKATDAAVRHFRDLSREFGSPLLAAAAYNGGAGLVRRGLARLRIAGTDSLGSEAPLDADSADLDFFRLAERSLLPRETREYVPAFLAAAAIGREPERFGFARPSGPPFAFDSVLVQRSISLGALANAIGVERQSIMDLNPHFIRGATPPARNTWLRVPPGLSDESSRMIETLPTIRPASISSRPYTRIRVKRGDTVESIAAANQVAPEMLRRANALPPGFRLRPGQVLWIRK